MTENHRLLKGLALLIGVVATLAIADQVGHSTAVRVLAVVLLAAALIGVRVGIARDPAVPGHVEIPDPNADFVRYRSLVSAMRFAGNRRYDFDRATRPPLLRLYSRTLAEQHDVQIASDRERARELMGPVAWSLVEPGDVPPGSDPPGVGRASLKDMVSRLEELSS